jgi:alpha-glucosidase
MIRVEAPLETVPMFVRGGSVVPRAPSMNYVNEKPRDPITFEIYPDDDGRAAGTLYEDDGESPAYKKGSFRRTAVKVSSLRNGHRVVVEVPTNGYRPAPRKFVFAIRSGKIRKTATVPDNGKLQTVEVR